MCREQLLLAAEHLCELGARVLILGCTELPLVLAHSEAFQIGAHRVALVDPPRFLRAAASACLHAITAADKFFAGTA